MFKSASSKYNEVFHCNLYLIKELPLSLGVNAIAPKLSERERTDKTAQIYLKTFYFT